MRSAAKWAIGIGASAAAHALAAAVLVPAYAPGETQAQQMLVSKMQFETVETPIHSAREAQPDLGAAAEAQADSTLLTAGTVVQLHARAVAPEAPHAAQALAASRAAKSVSLPSAPMKVAARPAQAIAAATPRGDRAADAASPIAQAAAVAPPIARAADVAPQAAPAAQALVASRAAESVSLPSAPMTAAQRPAQAIAVGKPRADRAADAVSPIAQAAAVAPPMASAANVAPQATPAAQPPLPAESAIVSTALAFEDRMVTDPKAIATIQAFLAPDSLDNAAANAGQVLDDLSAVLTGVDCARLSAFFVPEKGVLEMRGHIPDPALQDGIMQALRAQMGEGIPVAANLLHLPKPQCGALIGIASVGLPQSTDQFTNERLVGATSHARAYGYTEGQRLQFDLTAPDYDAFVYVDYFNADGDVIHLVPNEIIPLEKYVAKAAFGVGTDRPGKPSLRITIGPPFGQEIAVAFASSHPLYDGLRPITEPAGSYLEFLRSRVAAARAAHPDFKGEWVYFFISTVPAPATVVR